VGYTQAFLPSALKEWRKFDKPLREQFKKKPAERLEQPHIKVSALSGLDNACKIKLRQVGYRLVYRVNESMVVVTVVAVGQRDRSLSGSSAPARR